MEYVYCKENNNLRCKIYRHNFLNGITIKLEERKKFFIFNLWREDGLLTEIACPNHTKIEDRENILISSINYLFKLKLRIIYTRN